MPQVKQILLHLDRGGLWSHQGRHRVDYRALPAPNNGRCVVSSVQLQFLALIIIEAALHCMVSVETNSNRKFDQRILPWTIFYACKGLTQDYNICPHSRYSSEFSHCLPFYGVQDFKSNGHQPNARNWAKASYKEQEALRK